MIDRDSDEYKIGLMEYAYTEIGFYGMCDALSNARTHFRRLSSVAQENLEKKYDIFVNTGYNKETCDEYIFDDDIVTRSQANEMQLNVENVMREIISDYEETLL